MAINQVCPNCFQPLSPNHVCNAAIPVESNSVNQKQEAIGRQVRKRYNHNITGMNHATIFVKFEIDYPADFSPEWLVKFIKDRCEIPEGPEDYPTIEDYYIKDAGL